MTFRIITRFPNAGEIFTMILFFMGGKPEYLKLPLFFLVSPLNLCFGIESPDICISKTKNNILFRFLSDIDKERWGVVNLVVMQK